MNRHLVVPCNYQDFISTESARVGAGKAVTAAKLKVYTDANKLHLQAELRIWKLCMATLTGQSSIMTRANTGADRMLLRAIRDENRLNETDKDAEELFSQFLSFSILETEVEDIELYKLRLKELKNKSKTFHSITCVYVCVCVFIVLNIDI